MRARWRWCGVAVVLWLWPAVVSADTFVTPYLGTTFDAQSGAVEPAKRLLYGIDVMWLGTSGVGFELDAAFSPNFFQPGDDEELFDFESDGNVVTLMGNIVFGYEGGGVQPYVIGGFGLMRTRVEDPLDIFSFSDNGFGLNAGGGLRVGGRAFGIRGDLRYFRQLSDIEALPALELGDLSFWRATVGVSFGF